MGPDGSLYYLARGGGSGQGAVYQISGPTVTGQPPTVTQPPVSQKLPAGQAATFTVAATGPGPLQYQWQKDGTDIPGATGPSLTVANPTLADNGAQFRGS